MGVYMCISVYVCAHVMCMCVFLSKLLQSFSWQVLPLGISYPDLRPHSPLPYYVLAFLSNAPPHLLIGSDPPFLWHPLLRKTSGGEATSGC